MSLSSAQPRIVVLKRKRGDKPPTSFAVTEKPCVASVIAKLEQIDAKAAQRAPKRTKVFRLAATELPSLAAVEKTAKKRQREPPVRRKVKMRLKKGFVMRQVRHELDGVFGMFEMREQDALLIDGVEARRQAASDDDFVFDTFVCDSDDDDDDDNLEENDRRELLDEVLFDVELNQRPPLASVLPKAVFDNATDFEAIEHDYPSSEESDADNALDVFDEESNASSEDDLRRRNSDDEIFGEREFYYGDYSNSRRIEATFDDEEDVDDTEENLAFAFSKMNPKLL